jgi:hypothetical protein
VEGGSENIELRYRPNPCLMQHVRRGRRREEERESVDIKVSLIGIYSLKRQVNEFPNKDKQRNKMNLS